MADLLGHSIGSYHVDGVIGHGRSGDVYHGRHVRTGQEAAVKILGRSVAVGVEFPDRFLAEMQTVSTLRHRNIVQVCEFGVSERHCFIAMEMLRGGSLGALLRHRPPGEPLPLTLTVNLMCQAAEGLAHAHQQGVVHKDIRPTNLLLDNSADEPTMLDGGSGVKIIDFGLAQLAGGGSTLTSVEMVMGAGVLLGDPAYMSPEQLRGQTLDGRTDLYSLGVVLYEMTTGMLPFAVRHLEDAVREHLFTPPPLPRLLNAEIPASMEQVVLRCLAKHPEDRYDTGIDLVRAMRAAVPSA
ncbi:MAG TPA: serine/threonine-protein kinase [Ktedonobacterales bacterium]